MKHNYYIYKRPINQYDIQSARYYALRYPEWKEELMMDDTDPERQEELKKKIRLIEDTAREVSPDLYPWLIKFVTDGKCTYKQLREEDAIPCIKSKLHYIKRLFYALLAERI